jgi:hypothetical protein
MSPNQDDFGKTLSQMRDAQTAARDFRKQVEESHRDLGPQERIQALLTDILCLLHMEFYVRPKDS